jgi:hypothetical protein
MSKSSIALRPVRLIAGALLVAFASSSVSAQSSEPRAQAQPAQPAQPAKPAEPAKNKPMVEKFQEAGRSLGGPAANPECLWHGQKIVSLLYNNDMDTAFRHIDMYERFGCPSGHIQAGFRCLLWQGEFDMKDPQALQVRIHNCWINPTQPPAEATAAAPPPAGAAPTAKQ